MTTYSFEGIQGSISGPGGSFSIGQGAGAADEGIDVDMVEDKNTMTIGADGSGMHSLHASKAGTMTVRLLKTSPVNQLLNQMYNLQSTSSTLWGQNVITFSDIARGDQITGRQAAFKKQSPVKYAKDGNTMEWAFDCIEVDELLGSGAPSLS